MSLEKLLEVDSTFILFTAPPAWGKTRMLFELFKGLDKKILYISPLKALGLEFFENSKENFKTYGLGSDDFRKDAKSFLESERGVLVATPELLSSELVCEIGRERSKYVIVIDEIHLFFCWGKTFRPHLLEVLWGIMSEELTLLALSATISPEVSTLLREGVVLNYRAGIHIDVGNRELLYKPAKTFFYGSLGVKFLNRKFLSVVREKDGTVIYFLKYRRDVQSWLDFCRRERIDAIGCVGGEVDYFIYELGRREKPPQCIFSTTVLSHGVNLPKISGVFIGYKVDDQDFFLQMVGRGGRRGGEYSVYSMESFNQTFLEKCWSTLVNFSRDFVI